MVSVNHKVNVKGTTREPCRLSPAPGLAATKIFGIPDPEPGLSGYLATVRNNPSGHLWHAVFQDAGPGCLYLTALLLMPKENRAALLGWVVGRGAK